MANSQSPAPNKISAGSRILKQEKVSKAATSALVANARGGDAKSKKKLVAAYAYLPQHFAAKLGASVDQLPEAIKVGVEALDHAIDRYKLSDPEHFTNYVRRLTEHRIKSHLNRKCKPAKIRKKHLSKYQLRLKAEFEMILALGAQLKKQLTKQQYDVIRFRFGIAGRNRKTLTEIGRIMDLSRARVHKIEREAVGKFVAAEFARSHKSVGSHEQNRNDF